MFGFPIIDRPQDFKYKSNFLNTVTFQLDYSAISFSNDLLQKLKDLLGKKYTNIQNAVEGRLDIFGSGLAPKVHPIKNNGIKCTLKDNSITLTVSDNKISYTIQGKYYTNFNSFKMDHQKEINGILKILNISTLTRIAIRKVNIINFELKDEDFSYVDILGLLFNSKLVENMKIIPGSKYLKQAFNTMVLINEANYWLNLNYGFVKDIKSVNKANGVLDIDIINRNESKKEKIFEVFESINNEINVFSWSLQDSTRNQLNT
jgi:uncharacterized protein (TIGR04255 family)